jgi:hypothetical protein
MRSNPGPNMNASPSVLPKRAAMAVRELISSAERKCM